MGNGQGGGGSNMDDETINNMLDFSQIKMVLGAKRRFRCDAMAGYSVVGPTDPDLAYAAEVIAGTKEAGLGELRAMGALLGMAVGDSLGAPLEFSPVRYGSTELKTMGDACWKKSTYNRFGLKPGQWTDDASMGLCLADSLLASKGFNGNDLRLRFHNWWNFGLNNAFGCDQARKPRSSVGLGGNISQAMTEFETNPERAATQAGDRMTSGNGSVMRAAAAPIYFHDNYENAVKFSRSQSLTTHQGDEAAECCALMAHVIVGAINSKETDCIKLKKELLLSLKNFKSELYSVTCLANSIAEEEHPSNKKLDLADRNWDWKDADFHYAESRARQQPGYVGSYCMDAVAMALHCVWTTSSFEEAVLKCVNTRGDSDSTGSVCAQLAGAIYGVRTIPPDWIKCVQQWDHGGTIAARALKLYRHTPLEYIFTCADFPVLVAIRKEPIEVDSLEGEDGGMGDESPNARAEREEEEEEEEEASKKTKKPSGEGKTKEKERKEKVSSPSPAASDKDKNKKKKKRN